MKKHCKECPWVVRNNHNDSIVRHSMKWKKDAENPGGSVGGGASDDPVYDEAVQFVLSQGKASISLLQRRFRIGFNRAARYIEQMEMEGILGPQEGSKPRKVLVKE